LKRIPKNVRIFGISDSFHLQIKDGFMCSFYTSVSHNNTYKV